MIPENDGKFPPREMAPWLKQRLSTVQLANEIFMGMAVNPANVTMPPDVLVRNAFAFAETFDSKVKAYLQPPTIHAPPPDFKP